MSNELISTTPPLREFRAQLRALGGDWTKRLRKVNSNVAKQASAAIKSAYSAQFPRRSGAGASSIRAQAGQTDAAVAFGGSRAPYVVGQEFGSNRYAQFRPWTGRGPGGKGSRGRFAYPTLREMTPDIKEQHGKEIDDLFREAFPD